MGKALIVLLLGLAACSSPAVQTECHVFDPIIQPAGEPAHFLQDHRSTMLGITNHNRKWIEFCNDGDPLPGSVAD